VQTEFATSSCLFSFPIRKKLHILAAKDASQELLLGFVFVVLGSMLVERNSCIFYVAFFASFEFAVLDLSIFSRCLSFLAMVAHT